jgi:hypothetical protein
VLLDGDRVAIEAQKMLQQGCRPLTSREKRNRQRESEETAASAAADDPASVVPTHHALMALRN